MGYKYKVGEQTIELEARDDALAVRYREPSPHSLRAAFAQGNGLDFGVRFEVPNEKYTVLALPGDAPSESLGGVVLAAARADSGVARTSRVFRYGEIDVVPTDRVLLGMRDAAEPVAPLLRGLRTIDVQSRGNGEFTVRLAEDADSLEVADRLARHPAVRYAEPDFVNICQPMSRAAPGRPGATALAGGLDAGQSVANGQYAMVLTQAVAAWAVVAGSPDVRVAILDVGVDTRHRDLRSAVVGSYDALDGDDFQEPNPWDAHGTACAGLAIARPSGASGVRGVADGCSLMAVRIARSDAPGERWVSTNDGIGGAIDWCWRNGADVLSNSWGGGAPSNRVAGAFERARRQGRGGLGCVIVIAAGNAGREVSFPATLPGVIAVSASNEHDEFKSFDSSDGETGWGSNFGGEISVAAPGVHNLSTDISGPAGYDPSAYYALFNGTSSSAPLVAGAAALMLSANPALSQRQVREIILATADKVGVRPYVAGRNDEFGHGRINVLEAVLAAQVAVP